MLLTVFHCFPPFYAQEQIAPIEQQERFALVPLYKRATVSDSLRLLMAKERPAQFALFLQQIALSLTKKSDSLEKLMS